MHYKIMILLSDERHQRLMHCAETILHEIAGSFGHTFSLRYEKIGKLSSSAYDVCLTEETVEACQKCQVIFMDDADAAGADELLDALNIRLSLRFCGVPQGSAEESAFDFWAGKIRSLDAESVKEAMEQAFGVAEKMLVPVSNVAPNGNSCALWNREFQAQTLLHPTVTHKTYTVKDAAQCLFLWPEKLGIFLAPPYAGSIYVPIAQVACTAPFAVYDMAVGKEGAVYAPVHEEAKEKLSPIGYAEAISSMLRNTMNLSREADCLDSALHNVLEYGWCTPDMLPVDESKVITPEEMTELICEQINLAGQLMQDVGEIIA